MMHKKSQSGFSLVETLVAITILLIVIVGPMTISSQSARSTSFASEQVVAFFLAQEGAELIQKERDNYFNLFFEDQTSNPTPWSDFKSAGVYTTCLLDGNGRGCGIEVLPGANGPLQVTRCSGGPCELYFDDDSASVRRSRYTHVSTDNLNTPYSREVVIETVAGTLNELKITSTVYWRSGNIRDEQSISVETYLFNTYGE